MREIDPFSFFINHASAISGLGGDALSPDPRYCFHTPYTGVRPGPARYELHLRRVRASRGELALRIHALRPGTNENASLVAGARMDVALDDPQDMTISVPFSALRNVEYAFYGYFTEDSDIAVEGFSVRLHEFDGAEEDLVEPPRSILALDNERGEVRPANALIHVVTPQLTAPVSQDCSMAQIAALRTGNAGPLHRGADRTRGAGDWAEALCLNALRAYDITVPALEGVVVGHASDAFLRALADAGFAVQQLAGDPPPAGNAGLFGDFMVWPEGLGAEPDGERRWNAVRAWFGRLKIGGLGVVICRYRPGDSPVSSRLAGEGAEVTANEIGKWALRLIAAGYTVAPLAFSPRADLWCDDAGLARFALIARRV